MIQHNTDLKAAFFDAVHEGNIWAVEKLLENEEISQNQDLLLLSLKVAIRAHQLGIVDKILSVNGLAQYAAKEDNEALSIAVEIGNLPIVNRLLAFEEVVQNLGAINSYGCDIFTVAVFNGQVDIVKRLLEIPEVIAIIKDPEHDAMNWVDHDEIELMVYQALECGNLLH
ncbi:MAG: hypothetical protein JSR17_09280 [Proteobacteria bacterium]|nr:hypothetical protein [Pseudomonadota bacterium]